ncbi:hypothetical protein D3C87_1661650 [compost metagenome]
MDCRRRTRIDAPGGLAHHQHARLLQDFPAHDVFLQIAAGQRPSRRCRAKRLDREIGDHLAGIGARRAGIDQSQHHHAQPVARRQHRIVRQAEITDRRVAIAFLGDRAQPVPPPLGGVHQADADAVYGYGIAILALDLA